MSPKYYTDNQRAAAFWAKVDVREPLECWPWKASVNWAGYGKVGWIGRGWTGAHRVAFFLSGSYLPEGKHVLHTCDNPRCCNPAHLFIGTASDNLADARSKGRLKVKGTDHAFAKLSEADVIAMRADRGKGMSFTALGARYNVHRMTAYDAVKKRTWKHLV